MIPSDTRVSLRVQRLGIIGYGAELRFIAAEDPKHMKLDGALSRRTVKKGGAGRMAVGFVLPVFTVLVRAGL